MPGSGVDGNLGRVPAPGLLLVFRLEGPWARNLSQGLWLAAQDRGPHLRPIAAITIQSCETGLIMAADTKRNRYQSPQAGPGQVAERVPRTVIITAIGLLTWLVVPWDLFLGTTVQGELIFAVCLVFSVVAFGTSSIIVAQVLASRHVRRQGRDAGCVSRKAQKLLATCSGELPMKAAAVQILLIPGSVAVAFTALALIDVVIRS